MTDQRTSGILLHITSLPSAFGIGDLGPAAYAFVDLLAASGQRYWQVLPLNPTDPAFGNSPYSSASAFAMEPLLISPDRLVECGYLHEDDIAGYPSLTGTHIDYATVGAAKRAILELAWTRFQQSAHDSRFHDFCREHAVWLNTYVLFVALKRESTGRVWNQWENGLRTRDSEALKAARDRHADALERERFFQFLVFQQWFDLKRYANERGVLLVGDVPIYVNYDSVDVWSNPSLFKLDEQYRPRVVAGVPPDYFSKTGQLWGNPVYDWAALQASGFEWWMGRLGHTLHLFDKVRIDHFRGLVAYWEVPFGDKTAVNGVWQAVPSEDFFTVLRGRFPGLPIIAEDLGVITEDVAAVRERFGFPGMKLVIFAFDEDNPNHPYLPHNIESNTVAYTGTHDNNTARGWYEHEADEATRERLQAYVGHRVTPESVHRDLARLVMMTASRTAIIPMQDVLGLGAEARMNVPSTPNGNWTWRLHSGQATPEAVEWFADCTRRFGRYWSRK